MNNHKALFSLPDDIHYINGAYMSPLLKTAADAGRKAILQKENPTLLSQEDFFLPVTEAKQSYARLINASPAQIAVIPSASYGFASAFNNLSAKGRKKAICVGEEFPSGYFTLVKWCKTHDMHLEIIKKPSTNNRRIELWQEAVLNGINSETSLVLISAIHWMDGSKFDLKVIGEKCLEYNVPLLVDGTQAVGATPIDVSACHITALVNPSYKWLMGPYGLGFAYYATSLNDGIPLEESWMNRVKAMDFSNLTDYNEKYQPGAGRYDIGESANFINLAIMKSGVDFINDFGVTQIEQYCHQLVQPLYDYLESNGFWVVDKANRAPHLFGFELPERINIELLKKELQENKVHLSFRKKSIRVSPNIYNTSEDIQCLINCLKKID